MKHNVGDVVRIKSKEWYEKNKNQYGNVAGKNKNEAVFVPQMSECCGIIATITEVLDDSYHIDKFNFLWTDEMFEDSMEDPLSEESLNNFTCLIPEPCIYWEQRRYELVKSIMSNVLQKSILSDRDVKFNAQRAIDLADEVIKQLKEKEVKK